ncbi:hypothetical protein BZA77DRAFT_310978 [Pyronema omphalodes]|nr:hypothetical protein BZA77DRAFT_310978 [Pyronema omphalodes]
MVSYSIRFLLLLHVPLFTVLYSSFCFPCSLFLIPRSRSALLISALLISGYSSYSLSLPYSPLVIHHPSSIIHQSSLDTILYYNP